MRRDDDHVGGDFQVLEDDFRFRDAAKPHGRFAGADDQSLGLQPPVRIADGDKTGDTLFLAVLEDAGEDQMQFRDAAAGNPVLGSIKNIDTVFLVGAGGHLVGGAAGARLGDANGGLVAVQHQAGGQVFLFVGAVGHDRADGAHVALDDDSARDPADLGHFLDHQHNIQVAEPQASHVLGDGHAHESAQGQRADVVPGVFLASVDFGGAGPDYFLGQLPGGVTQVLLAFRESEHGFVLAEKPANSLNSLGAADGAAFDAPPDGVEKPMPSTPTPLSPVLGAEMTGLDLTQPLGANLVSDIRQAWLEAGGLLVIRDQRLTPEQHIQFSRNFGPLFGAPGEAPLQETVSRYLHPDHPEIYRVSNKVEAGEPLGRARAGTYWHSDVSFRERPAAASIIHAIEIPQTGGDTLFANMAAAFDALSETMKDLLGPVRAVHDFAQTAATQFAQPIVVGKDLEGGNRAVHPVVRTHPETGGKSLFVNPGMTTHLENFHPGESKALLGLLFEHATRPEFCYRHRWRRDDVVMWDNRSLMHYAVADYGDQPRYMERTTGIGEVPE